MDYKLGLVGTEKSYSVSIINPFVVITMNQLLIREAQLFRIQIVLNRIQLFTACNTKRKKELHPFHVRIPIILENFCGQLFVEGLVCKGFEI